MKIKMKKKVGAKTSSLPIKQFIPDIQLQVKKRQISDVIKHTPTEELHHRFKYFKEFYTLVETTVKEEVFARMRKYFTSSGERTLTTKVGKIQLVRKNNYSFQENNIIKFLQKKKIPLEQVFDTDYVVLTTDKNILRQLVDKKYIKKTMNVNTEKFSAVMDKYPELSEYVDVETTEYIRGL